MQTVDSRGRGGPRERPVSCVRYSSESAKKYDQLIEPFRRCCRVVVVVEKILKLRTSIIIPGHQETPGAALPILGR